MDIQFKKLELIEWITQITDSNIISKMEKIRKKYIAKTNEELKPLTVREFNKIIDRAEKDAKDNKITLHEDLIEQSENW